MMKNTDTKTHLQRVKEAEALLEIEDNPLTEEDKELFEMFEREGWSVDQQIEHFKQLARAEFAANKKTAPSE